MNKIFTLFISILFFFNNINSLKSQYFYVPSSVLGNPGGLNNDSEYPSSSSSFGTGWTTILTGGNTTPTWSAIETIPFSFNFNGSQVTQYKVSSSGVLTFTTSAGVVPFYTNNLIPDPVIPNSSVMIWGIQGVGSNDEIVTKTFGTLGSQQHWIFFASYEAGGSWSYWSIVLEEGSDKIYLVDQRHSSNANPQVTAGIQIDSANAIMVSGSPTLSNLAGTDPTPADNHYYEFIYGSQNAIDVSGIEITNFPYLYLNDAPYNITSVFRNLGMDTINNMKINYSVDGGNTISEYLPNLNIISYEEDTSTFSTSWNPLAPGTYDVSIWADSINGGIDLDNSNDTLHNFLHVFDTKTQRMPMLESFASSTSQYSVNGNIDLQAILGFNQDNYTLLKYPMSWPTPGDPYYTFEGRQRRIFYGINTVPRLVTNGIIQYNPIGYTQQEFDEARNFYSFMDLSAEYSVGGQTVDITISIDPLCNTEEIWENLILHTAIFEYTTYNNASTNGEIEFYNIMKKMLPDANGTNLPDLYGPNNPTWTTNLSYTFNGSYILPADATNPIDHTMGNSVEDFQNLGVAVWIQDLESKYILQSTIANMVTNVNKISKDDILVYPNPSSNYINIILPKKDQIFFLEIYNILGDLVFCSDIPKSSLSYRLDLSSYNSGFYHLIIKNGVSIINKKIEVFK